MKRITVLAVVLVLLAGASLAPVAAQGREAELYGHRPEDRLCMAVVTSAHDAHLADSLAGAALAGQLMGALYLTWGDDGPALVRDMAGRVEQVMIVGGAHAVPASVERSLRDAGYIVTRLAGADRVETSALVREYARRALSGENEGFAHDCALHG
jgi:putative cell wall-binding protein